MAKMIKVTEENKGEHICDTDLGQICYIRHKMQEPQSDNTHFIKIKNLDFLKSQ